MEAYTSPDLQSASWSPNRDNCIIPDQRPAGLRSKKNQCFSWSPRPMSQIKAVRQEKSILTQPFCSTQVFSWLEEAHPFCGRQSALLSLLIHMLILSRNTLTDTPRTMFVEMTGHPIVLSSWHEIHYHNVVGRILACMIPTCRSYRYGHVTWHRKFCNVIKATNQLTLT